MVARRKLQYVWSTRAGPLIYGKCEMEYKEYIFVYLFFKKFAKAIPHTICKP